MYPSPSVALVNLSIWSVWTINGFTRVGINAICWCTTICGPVTSPSGVSDNPQLLRIRVDTVCWVCYLCLPPGLWTTTTPPVGHQSVGLISICSPSGVSGQYNFPESGSIHLWVCISICFTIWSIRTITTSPESGSIQSVGSVFPSASPSGVSGQSTTHQSGSIQSVGFVFPSLHHLEYQDNSQLRQNRGRYSRLICVSITSPSGVSGQSTSRKSGSIQSVGFVFPSTSPSGCQDNPQLHQSGSIQSVGVFHLLHHGCVRTIYD